MSQRPIRGQPPSDQDIKWLELMQEARKTSLKSLDDAARQLIGLAPILSGLYAATLGLAKIKPDYWQSNAISRLIFVAPILFWLISLCVAVTAVFPQAYTYNPYRPDEARDIYNTIISTKHWRLKVSLLFLILSMLALLLAVWTYLGISAEGRVV
jgi:hypothetical protein